MLGSPWRCRRVLPGMVLVLGLAPLDAAGAQPGALEASALTPGEGIVFDAEQDRLQEHFADVLAALRSRDVGHLDAVTRDRRAAALDAVEAYAAAGVFPHNPGVPHPQEVFIDSGGRRCAMAELLFVTGAGEDAEAIAARSPPAIRRSAARSFVPRTNPAKRGCDPISAA